MMIINLIIMLLISKIAYSVEFVDLRNNYISDAVFVFHGRFMEYGSYKMFCGGETSLELVYYGHVRLYPPIDYTSGNHTLLVELYRLGESKIINIFDFYKVGDVLHRTDNIHYELGNTGFVRITDERMNDLIRGPVFLSVDISKKEIHPFIYPKYDKYQGFWAITYTMRKAYFGMEIGSEGVKQYFIGKVFDSTRPVYTGFTRISSFVERCTHFKVKRSDSNESVEIVIRHKRIKFDRLSLLGNLVWYTRLDPLPTYQQVEHRYALDLKSRIDSHVEEFSIATLDISDNISNKLFVIDKVNGKVIGWNYELYQIKESYSSRTRIRFVIDTKVHSFLICKVNPDAFKTIVEVYRNYEISVVIVRSLVDKGVGNVKEVRMFEKKFSDKTEYKECSIVSIKAYMFEFNKLYPILIDIYLDSIPTSLVKHGEKQLIDGKVKYYRIKEVDELEEYIRFKYMIEDIWERDYYEKGNIPIEGYRIKYKLVEKNIRSNKFIIAAIINEFSLQGSGLETYTVIRK